MPLRAIINDVDIIAPLLNSEEWEQLKIDIKKNKYFVKLPCCGQQGFLRTSKTGLNHFYHKHDDKICNWKPESAEHLKLKYEILKACQESGWTAIPEYSENDWRADVFAYNGKNRLAFEVQLSKQTYEETIERQNKYTRDKVRGCWFFKKILKTADYESNFILNNKEIPLFELDLDSNEFRVKFYNRKFVVGDFVKHLLSKHIKFCSVLRSTLNPKVDLSFFPMSCWRCGKTSHIYYVHNVVNSICDLPIGINDNGLWSNFKFEYHPQILKKAIEIGNDPTNGIVLGEIKKRASKQAYKSYMSFGCAYCDSLFGDWFISEAYMECVEDETCINFEMNLNLSKPYEKEYNHWCFSENNNFCE